MPNLLTEQEFTERFTEAISKYELEPSCKEKLVVELNYGADEPILTISLKEAFARYIDQPEQLNDILRPYIDDIGWTVHSPCYSAKEVYEQTLPTMRNFLLVPATRAELDDTGESPKGPIVYDRVLTCPSELIVMQFNMFKDDTYTPLRKGDTIRCIPDLSLLAQLSLHNLALVTESAGITATPLHFQNLKAKSWLIGLGDDKYKHSIAALSCIEPVMSSLQETFKARNGLIAIMPADDQLIVSTDTNEEAVAELGVLAQQLLRKAPVPLSELIWSFDEGNLQAVQALELDEIRDLDENRESV